MYSYHCHTVISSTQQRSVLYYVDKIISNIYVPITNPRLVVSYSAIGFV